MGGEHGGRGGRRRNGRVGRVRRIDLAAAADVPPGTMQLAWADGTDAVLLVNVGGTFHAFQGTCSHEYFELDKGFLNVSGGGGARGATLTCALHLSRFDLETGEALDPPAEVPLALYDVSVEGGRIVLELPEGGVPVNG